ncbi:MAG: Trp biosynthesis-associated membrane protein [Austwickia sp.]|nr:Trp biosynthesis-associated membrane protein [Austwickia sp.]
MSDDIDARHDGPAPTRGARPRRTAVLVTVAGAGLAGLAALPTWVSGEVSDTVTGRSVLTGTGTAVAPAVLLLVAVAVAAIVAASIGGRLLRLACGAAQLLAGAAMVVAAVRVLADPAAALLSSAVASTGRAGGRPDTAATTVWPAVCAVGGMAVLVGSVLVLRAGPGWAARSGRFDRHPVVESGDGGAPVDAWERLSRDEDPT